MLNVILAVVVIVVVHVVVLVIVDVAGVVDVVAVIIVLDGLCCVFVVGCLLLCVYPLFGCCLSASCLLVCLCVLRVCTVTVFAEAKNQQTNKQTNKTTTLNHFLFVLLAREQQQTRHCIEDFTFHRRTR